jgi:hypothetical protein
MTRYLTLLGPFVKEKYTPIRIQTIRIHECEFRAYREVLPFHHARHYLQRRYRYPEP